jgi:hypothetical protein
MSEIPIPTQIIRELESLRAFKTYVHHRLDHAGVPENPDPEANAEHGCRIEGRLNYLVDALGESFAATDHLANVVCGMLFDNERQREHVATHAICAWCGHDGLRLPDEMREHAEQCTKHPMHALRAELDRKVDILKWVEQDIDSALTLDNDRDGMRASLQSAHDNAKLALLNIDQMLTKP